MGWYYEVDITDDVTSINKHLEHLDRIIVQGKNSQRDYGGYYLDHGKPFRYPSLAKLMPETEGELEHIRLIADWGDVNSDTKGGFIEYRPGFLNGKWRAEELEGGE